MENFLTKIFSAEELTGSAYTCQRCGVELFRYDEYDLCEICKSLLTLTENIRECERCGSPLKKDNPSEFCGECNSEEIYYYRLRGATVMDEASRHYVLALKLGKNKDNARLMARFIADKLYALEWEADVIVPVPTYHEGKRYFNHSEFIALELAKITGIPFSNALLKIKKNEGQENKNRKERKINVEGVYGLSENADFTGKTVLLVDDVKTSGATMNECSKTLIKDGNADKVFGIAFAATKLKKI